MLTNLLNEIRDTKGTNSKKELIRLNKSKEIFLKFLDYALNPYTPFHIVKIPKTKKRESQLLTEIEVWDQFFEVAKQCSSRVITGNAAINAMSEVFHCATEDQEKWMRKVLKKHLAIGVSQKTVNSVIPGHIPTFDVALAQKFELKRIKTDTVYVEPKLDGIRCLTIVENGEAKLFTRAGKLITNFDNTLGKELALLSDGCYDGEVMSTDFTDLMRQVYRKENKDISEVYLALFDYVPLQEWKNKKGILTAKERYAVLEERLGEKDLKYLQLVKRALIKANYDVIKDWHDCSVKSGYEGVMIKAYDAPYCFGRDWSVMKFKAFFDADVHITGMKEGTGKHSGKLGSFVVDYKGVEVRVGSGLTDELREQLWEDTESHVGRIIEVRYQEETPDGSLRFPTFVCFRNDK